MKLRNYILPVFALAAMALGHNPALAQNAQPANYRNVLIGGDFGVNPYQRGTANSSTINTTATYHADAWAGWANNGAAALVLSRQTSGMPFGFQAAEQMQRTAANASTQQICLGQEIETADVIGLQGQTMVLSWFALAGANFSPTGSLMQPVITTGTGTDQGLASLLAATWTGQANVALTGTAAASTNWARYSVTFVMPTTATEAAAQICWTPTGTAGASDFLQVTGIQLEVVPAGNPAVAASPSPFEKRPAGQEAILAFRRFYQVNETNGGSFNLAQAVATTSAVVQLPFPRPMRAVPTCTAAFGGFNMTIAAGTNTATSALAVLASSPTIFGAAFTATTGATLAAGNATRMVGTGTTGNMACTADF